MAVRDDFTAGEVLAAADLNDTFASKLPYSYGTATPSTTDSGFLWYDSNSTPPVPKYWNGSAFARWPGGLQHIVTETWSAVSSVSVNGCFSAAYDNYVITLTGVTGSTSSATVNMRLRASGTDASGTDYNRQILVARSSTLIGQRDTGQTWFEAISRTTTADINYAKIDLFDPFRAVGTHAQIVDSEGSASTSESIFMATFNHYVGASYDGFTLFPSGGTFSGTLRVYGYQNT